TPRLTPTTPKNPTLGALAGAKYVLDKTGADWPQISGFIHGTTLATNALIERRGAVVATVTSEGFRDILEIAYERRYNQYEINLVKPDLIVLRARAFTIKGRMDARGQELQPFDDGAVSRLVEELSACGESSC
uniref:hydantoinase/oxoprolinase N-terminal domain-containing protein n=1 Tax=Ruegeria conchae TaxID=981384 RepID=UPI000237B58C